VRFFLPTREPCDLHHDCHHEGVDCDVALTPAPTSNCRNMLPLADPRAHSVRLFGHITLKVFAGFVTLLGAIGWIGGIMPLALTALELLVAFLQAYVFAILTCIYLNDAIHPGH